MTRLKCELYLLCTNWVAKGLKNFFHADTEDSDLKTVTDAEADLSLHWTM